MYLGKRRRPSRRSPRLPHAAVFTNLDMHVCVRAIGTLVSYNMSGKVERDWTGAISACLSVCACVHLCATVCDCVRLCATVCDYVAARPLLMYARILRAHTSAATCLLPFALTPSPLAAFPLGADYSSTFFPRLSSLHERTL
jgi:hypothetical protein